MENNLEKKAKFFAQYWGQKVFKIQDENCPATQEVNPQFIGKFLDEKSVLELKPISSITDEDQNYILTNELSNSNKLVIQDKIGAFYLSDIYVTDYLRSKGYALPYMGLSVEKQIEYGWIKLEVQDGMGR